MIRKVALVQALREAFPLELGGLLSEDEISTESLAPIKSGSVIEQEIKAINTVEELEDWYKQNRKAVDKDVLGLLSARKRELFKNQEDTEVVVDAEVVE